MTTFDSDFISSEFVEFEIGGEIYRVEFLVCDEENLPEVRDNDDEIVDLRQGRGDDAPFVGMELSPSARRMREAWLILNGISDSREFLRERFDMADKAVIKWFVDAYGRGNTLDAEMDFEADWPVSDEVRKMVHDLARDNRRKLFENSYRKIQGQSWAVNRSANKTPEDTRYGQSEDSPIRRIPKHEDPAMELMLESTMPYDPERHNHVTANQRNQWDFAPKDPVFTVQKVRIGKYSACDVLIRKVSQPLVVTCVDYEGEEKRVFDTRCYKPRPRGGWNHIEQLLTREGMQRIPKKVYSGYTSGLWDLNWRIQRAVALGDCEVIVSDGVWYARGVEKLVCRGMGATLVEYQVRVYPSDDYEPPVRQEVELPEEEQLDMGEFLEELLD